MSSSVSYKPLLRTEQRRQQQRSNEAQHQIHLTLFASSFHHPHSLFPFCFLPRSLCFALGQWVEPHWRNPLAGEWVNEMFRSARWRSEKNRVKAVFKLHFHATQVTFIFLWISIFLFLLWILIELKRETIFSPTGVDKLSRACSLIPKKETIFFSPYFCFLEKWKWEFGIESEFWRCTYYGAELYLVWNEMVKRVVAFGDEISGVSIWDGCIGAVYSSRGHWKANYEIRESYSSR